MLKALKNIFGFKSWPKDWRQLGKGLSYWDVSTTGRFAAAEASDGCFNSRARGNDKPYLVFLAERHDIPLGVYQQQATIEAFRRLNPHLSVMVADESSENYINDLLFIPPYRGEEIKMDWRSTGSVLPYLALLNREANKLNAPVATNNLMAYLIENEIPCMCVDAPIIFLEDEHKSAYVDYGNRKLQDMLARRNIHLDGKDSSAFSRLGIYTRNIHMFETATDYAKKNNIDVIFFRVGNDHVVDRKTSNIFSDATLPGIADAAGYDHCCILMDEYIPIRSNQEKFSARNSQRKVAVSSIPQVRPEKKQGLKILTKVQKHSGCLIDVFSDAVVDNAIGDVREKQERALERRKQEIDVRLG